MNYLMMDPKCVMCFQFSYYISLGTISMRLLILYEYISEKHLTWFLITVILDSFTATWLNKSQLTIPLELY